MKWLDYEGLKYFYQRYISSNKAVLLEAMVSAATWTGEEAPYTSTVSFPELTGAENELVQVFVPHAATSEQKAAWADACVWSGNNTEGALVLEAAGVKPEIDIPISVIKFADLSNGGD